MFYNETQLKLYTRGNGEVGQDISHMIPYIKQLNPLLDKKLQLEENSTFKKIFQDKYAKKFSNARNLVSEL